MAASVCFSEGGGASPCVCVVVCAGCLAHTHTTTHAPRTSMEYYTDHTPYCQRQRAHRWPSFVRTYMSLRVQVRWGARTNFNAPSLVEVPKPCEGAVDRLEPSCLPNDDSVLYFGPCEGVRCAGGRRLLPNLTVGAVGLVASGCLQQ